MNPLHAALLSLFNQDAQLAQDLQNAVAYSISERRSLAVAHSKRLYPARPAGKAYLPKAFWAVLANNRALHVAFCGPQTTADRLAQYIIEGMKWSGGKKPTARFAPPSHQPLPWDGKEERGGQIPWDGKQ